MLVATLKLKSPRGPQTLEAKIWNTSSLARLSDYDFSFENRTACEALKGYPRWCESVRGLVARCLSLAPPGNAAQAFEEDWQEAQVNIGLLPNGRGNRRELAMARIGRNECSTLNVGFSESQGLTGFIESVVARGRYEDAWSVAEHALRVSAFGSDSLPHAKPVELEVRLCGITRYIRTSDIAEPTRTVFESRMAHSGRPVVSGAGDAVYAWDWEDFLNGQR